MKPALFAVVNCPTPAGWCHSDRPRRRMRGRRRSRRLGRTTRGSGCRSERNAYEIGRSSWHDRHERARQHRDQGSGARLCFRKWPAGMPLTL